MIRLPATPVTRTRTGSLVISIFQIRERKNGDNQSETQPKHNHKPAKKYHVKRKAKQFRSGSAKVYAYKSQ